MSQAQLSKKKVDVSNITWEDVFDKMEYDRMQKTFTIISPKVKREEILNETKDIILHQGSMSTMICEGDYAPWSMRPLADYMRRKYNMREFHQYVSLNTGSSTFGRHNDNVNVMIVPIIGDIGYNVDGLGQVTMEPGDILHIPKYVYHEPIVFGPRATLSFS
tara:strand:+ start:5589 stop:6074 length:486 start_codon:yes stop_codon:yes gene_type:complete